MSDTLILTRGYIASKIPVGAYLPALRAAFEGLAAGQIATPEVGHVPCQGGAIHIKAAAQTVAPFLAVIKSNANFPANPQTNGLPTIQGQITVVDGQNGRLLAMLDSIEITARRTAGASALAATLMARADARVIAFVGCGLQATYHLEAFLEIFRLVEARCYDLDAACAARLAEKAEARGLKSRVMTTLGDCARGADIVITCTPSKVPILAGGDVSPGTFIAAVGADNPSKHEIAPDLMAAARVIPDVRAQAIVMGDSRHALEAGAIRLEDLPAELADVVVGQASGRTSDDEITIFDSTGTAVEDLAAAQVVLEHARNDPEALRVAFNFD